MALRRTNTPLKMKSEVLSSMSAKTDKVFQSPDTKGSIVFSVSDKKRYYTWQQTVAKKNVQAFYDKRKELGDTYVQIRVLS